MRTTDLSNLKILIVDDDTDIVELMEEELQLVGHDTYKAFSGNEAITLLKNQNVDVIISDFKMPNGSGMDLLNFVNRHMPKKPDFYFLSGQTDVTLAEMKQAGAKQLFVKPLNISELIMAISE